METTQYADGSLAHFHAQNLFENRFNDTPVSQAFSKVTAKLDGDYKEFFSQISQLFPGSKIANAIPTMEMQDFLMFSYILWRSNGNPGVICKVLLMVGEEQRNKMKDKQFFQFLIQGLQPNNAKHFKKMIKAQTELTGDNEIKDQVTPHYWLYVTQLSQKCGVKYTAEQENDYVDSLKKQSRHLGWLRSVYHMSQIGFELKQRLEENKFCRQDEFIYSFDFETPKDLKLRLYDYYKQRAKQLELQGQRLGYKGEDMTQFLEKEWQEMRTHTRSYLANIVGDKAGQFKDYVNQGALVQPPQRHKAKMIQQQDDNVSEEEDEEEDEGQVGVTVHQVEDYGDEESKSSKTNSLKKKKKKSKGHSLSQKVRK